MYEDGLETRRGLGEKVDGLNLECGPRRTLKRPYDSIRINHPPLSPRASYTFTGFLSRCSECTSSKTSRQCSLCQLAIYLNCLGTPFVEFAFVPFSSPYFHRRSSHPTIFFLTLFFLHPSPKRDSTR